jgi:hypothetical protein
MRKVTNGTKIQVPTASGNDFGIILEHRPSQYSKDVYMVKWLDGGSQTLFHLKKENLIQNDKQTTKKKTT